MVYSIFLQVYTRMMSICWKNSCKHYFHVPRRWNSSWYQQENSAKPTFGQILAKKISRVRLARQLERKPVLHPKMRRERFLFRALYIVCGGLFVFNLADIIRNKNKAH